MRKRIYYLTQLIIILGIINVDAQTALEGKVVYEKTKEPVMLAQVAMYKQGVLIAGVETDFDGNYSIGHIDAGVYDVEATYVGFAPRRITGVEVKPGQVTRLDITMTDGIQLDAVHIVEFKKPLIEIDNTSSGGTLTAEEISQLSLKNLNALANITSGAVNVRGQRAKGAVYYLDGVRVAENSVKTEKQSTKKQSTKTHLAGKLTATEVNDFADWEFWSMIQETDFFQTAIRWKMNPQFRYAVQVQNADGMAISGVTVNLLTEGGSVLWETVSDNLGRAELFHSFIEEDLAGAYIEVLDGDRVLSKLSTELFVSEVQAIQVDLPCRNLDAIELAFLIDASTSMDDEIQFLQSEMIHLMETVKAKYPDRIVRAGVVYFQGHGDANPISYIPLTADHVALTDFIKNVGGRGGADEAIDLALETMIEKFNWSANSSKLAFIMTDEVLQNIPENRERLRANVQEAAAQGIKLVPIGCSGASKELEYVMRSMAIATASSYVALTDDSGIGHGHITPTASKIDVQSLSHIIFDMVRRSTEQIACLETSMVLEDMIAPDVSLNKANGQTWNNKDIVVYPNPTTSNFRLKRRGAELVELYVCDLAGRIIQTFDPTQKQFDISHLANGNYFVLGKEQSGAYFAKQIIKTNSSGKFVGN